MNGQPDDKIEIANGQTTGTKPVDSTPVESRAGEMQALEIQPGEGAQPGPLEDLTLESGPALGEQNSVSLQQPAFVNEPQFVQDTPLFQQWYAPPPPRIPHFGHFAILMAFLMAGFFVTGVLLAVAMRAHLFGLKTVTTALSDLDVRVALGTEIIAYAVMFVAALIFFPLIWHKGFFAGIQWNGGTALQQRKKVFMTALVCFGLAIINGLWISGPKNAPIEKIFHAPGAAWWLFGFGISLAPFFEEMIFRGFLLPSMCTAFDWMAEKFARADEKRIGLAGRPEWSQAVIIKVASVFASGPIILGIANRLFSTLVFVLIVLAYISVLAVFLAVIGVSKPKAPRLTLTFENGDHPVWSLPALVAGSLAASIPFAGMHAAQTGYSLGVFGLLVCISLVFCWVRLSTRSLAASTLVHASYNFLLFSMMLVGTSGFRHMDKL